MYIITTTHAVPQMLLPVRRRARLDEKTCCYCFEKVESGRPRDVIREAVKHTCKEQLLSQKPAVGLPFN